jgi:hypothetical protein
VKTGREAAGATAGVRPRGGPDTATAAAEETRALVTGMEANAAEVSIA